MMLATVAVVGQALVRQSDTGRNESEVARAMGFTPPQVRLLEMSSVLAVGLPGAVAAVLISIVLSPLFPVGAVRALEPERGFDVDWIVMAAGAAVIVGLTIVGYRLAARRWRWPVGTAAPLHAAPVLGAGHPAV